jgi:hypothetical protein
MLACAVLTACGGSGGGSDSAVIAPSGTSVTADGTQPSITTGASPSTQPASGSPTAATPATTGPTANTGTAPGSTPSSTSPATSPTTTAGTLPGTPTTSTDTSVYNSCANANEAADIETPLLYETQTYVLSGRGGDKSETTATQNLPQASLQGSGLYYVKSKVLAARTPDGLPIPAPQGAGKTSTLWYFERSNAKTGFVATENSTRNLGGFTTVVTDRYEPTFYDIKFTMLAGQTLEQTKSYKRSTTAGIDPEIAKSKAGLATPTQQNASDPVFSVTTKTRFVALEALQLGNKIYSTCKFESQFLVPASTELVTEWYLVGKGLLVQSITTDNLGTALQTTRLERASTGSKVIFPAGN